MSPAAPAPGIARVTAPEILRRATAMSADAGDDIYVGISFPLPPGVEGCELVREIAQLAGAEVEETESERCPGDVIVACCLSRLRDGMLGHVTIQGCERRSHAPGGAQ